jgi:nucleotide-binding universal stress UspA family protein
VAEASALRFLEARSAQTTARTRITVEYGLSPHQAVVAAIAAAGADLTVMSTHGRRGIAHALLGSVAETAIEEGGRPTICVRARHAAPAAGSYRRILVPTDLRARGAFPIAAFLARGFGAQVVAVHVVPAARAAMSGLPQGLESEVPGEDDVLRFLAPDFDGIPVSTRVELGSGWGAIPRIAREERCDLIAMHAGRRDGLSGVVLGSHAERIVALAPCPVLVV